MDEKPIYHRKGLALEGYDVVGYFDQKIMKGRPNLSVSYQGLEWRFVDQEHLDLFSSNPDKFLPKYGGYCAFGAANGYKAKPKMSSFHVMEGRLYFNFSDYIQERWLAERDQKIKVADQKWPATKSLIPIKANRHWVYIRYRFMKLFGVDTLK